MWYLKKVREGNKYVCYFSDEKGSRLFGSQTFADASPFSCGLAMVQLHGADLEKRPDFSGDYEQNKCFVTDKGKMSPLFHYVVERPNIFGNAIFAISKKAALEDSAMTEQYYMFNSKGNIEKIDYANSFGFEGNLIQFEQNENGNIYHIFDIYGEEDKNPVLNSGNRIYASVEPAEENVFLKVVLAEGSQAGKPLYRDILGNLTDEPTLLGREFLAYMNNDKELYDLDSSCFSNSRFAKAVKIREVNSYELSKADAPNIETIAAYDDIIDDILLYIKLQQTHANQELKDVLAESIYYPQQKQ